MNTASLELCKELYELSGWIHPHLVWEQVMPTSTPEVRYMDDTELRNTYFHYLAYDLGYLLRKLPKEKGNHTGLEFWGPEEISNWSAFWQPAWKKRIVRGIADTPEDAACQLAIELFKQGILK